MSSEITPFIQGFSNNFISDTSFKCPEMHVNVTEEAGSLYISDSEFSINAFFTDAKKEDIENKIVNLKDWSFDIVTIKNKSSVFSFLVVVVKSFSVVGNSQSKVELPVKINTKKDLQKKIKTIFLQNKFKSEVSFIFNL